MDSLSIAITAKGGIDKYPAKAHARRVASRIEQTKGIILLVGTKSVFYSHSDQQRPFRQDRYFYYLTGCNEPDCMLTYDLERDRLTLFLPPISWARFYYDGRGSTIEEALEAYDIDDARYLKFDDTNAISPFRIWLDEHSPGQSRIYMLSHEELSWDLDINDRNKSDFDSLQPAADACRAVKDEHEIELIRKANEITAAAHKDVLLQLHRTRSEQEAEAVYLKRCVASLAKTQAYEPIFAAGANASFLHYIQDNRPFADSQLLLIDAGCEWQRYSSDVTRTLPLNKTKPGHWPSREARLLYEAVERVQEACIRLMLPGALFSTVGRKAQELVVDELIKLGVLHGEPGKILRAGTHRAFFPHGLGHHLGLEVHDVIPLTAKTSPTLTHRMMPHCPRGIPSFDETSSDVAGECAMEPGNVITVEPGIYFNKFVLDRFFLPDPKHAQFINTKVLASYLPLGGVRIEDDILITEGGYENLTTAPKGAAMLRILRHASGNAAVDTD